MRQQGRRRLSDGREVSVHDNDGLRKICGCPRRVWAKCGHAWHFAFCWDGKHCRFSLDRFTGKRIEGKEDDIEAFIRHVAATRTTATRNQYVQLLRTVSTWAVRRGYREKPLATTESDVIRRKKASKRNRRLEPGEEDKLLAAAGPHLQRLIVAALETCCRLGELLSLQWCDVSLGRGEIVLRASKTKTATDRVIPISNRLRAVLEHLRHDPNGEPHGPMAYVFGDELGGRVKCVRRAWQTAVLKAHGQTPVWAWRQNGARKGTGKLAPASLERFRAINLHLHDLRHEAGSRLLEAGWPLHEVQQMLGHASLEQTSTYLNATLRGMHRSMRAIDLLRGGTVRADPQPSESAEESGNPCKLVASEGGTALLAHCKVGEASDDKSLIH